MADIESRLHIAIGVAQSLQRPLWPTTPIGSDGVREMAEKIESALRAAMEEIRELRAERRELQGRIALAMEAFDCCTDCVKTWLIGELDDEQKARVAEAQKRVSDAARAQAEDQS